MSQGKDGIQRNDLAKIWYQSLLKLPSDASFMDCRAAVLSAARKRLLSKSKIDLIKKAFDEAGISNNLYAKVWYYEDMKKALEKGYVQGYKDGSVKATKLMTNAEFLKVLTKAYECKVGTNASFDSTYPPNWKTHWARNELKYASDNKWISSTLDPDAHITRESAGVYLWKAYLTEQKNMSKKLKLKTYATTDKNAKVIRWNKELAFIDQNEIDCPDEMFQLYANEIYTGYILTRGMTCKLMPKEKLDRGTCCTIIMPQIPLSMKNALNTKLCRKIIKHY